MLLYLYKDSKENVVHASENKKHTGCRLNLTKAENVSRLSAAGTVDDLMAVVDQGDLPQVQRRLCQEADEA